MRVIKIEGKDRGLRWARQKDLSVGHGIAKWIFLVKMVSQTLR